MKTLRIAFYIIYIPTIVLTLIMAINLYDALDLFKMWGWFNYFSDLPVLGRKLIYLLCGLMTLSIVIETLVHLQARKDIKEAKATIKRLEERLYDRAQQETTDDGFVELDLDEISHS